MKPISHPAYTVKWEGGGGWSERNLIVGTVGVFAMKIYKEMQIVEKKCYNVYNIRLKFTILFTRLKS